MRKAKILENKRIKMTKLYDAAYELFASNGVNNTVIDDIVKSAGVAKGTFYLYCKDKYDLVNKIIIRKSSTVLNNAMNAVERKKNEENYDFQKCVIFFADYLIEYFKKDKKLLELIYRNLSWELYEKVMHYEEMEVAREAFIKNFVHAGGNSLFAKYRLYIIVSMVGSICYSSIVLNVPYKIDEIKSELYRSIERILA